MGFGKKLKLYLKENRLKQLEFAKSIGVNPSQLNKVLNEERYPSYEMLQNVALYFPKLDLNWLLRADTEVSEAPGDYVRGSTPRVLVDEIEEKIQLLKATLPKE